MSLLGNRPAVERAVWLFLALASALPFLVAPLPILPDLFSHIGRYHVMLHLDDPWLKQYYAFDWHITGNLGADLLMVLLGPLLGTEKAAYLIAGAVPPLMIWGIYRVSKALYGRIEPPAYLAILLVWSFTFHHGFINWWLGMALVFHVVTTWIDLARRRADPAVLRRAARLALSHKRLGGPRYPCCRHRICGAQVLRAVRAWHGPLGCADPPDARLARNKGRRRSR